MLVASSLLLTGCERLGFSKKKEEVKEEPVQTAGEFVDVSFDGVVYVDPSGPTSRAIEKVRHATQSAQRGLLEKKISVNSRALVSVDLKSVRREPVQMVMANGERKPMLRVRFHFKGEAIAPDGAADLGTVPFGLLINGEDTTRTDKVLGDCTMSEPRDKEYATTPWYVFNGSLDSCQRVIQDEHIAILRAREQAGLKEDEVLEAEATRLYFPIRVGLDRPGEAPKREARAAKAQTPSRSGRPGRDRATDDKNADGRINDSKDPGSGDGTHTPGVPVDPDLKPPKDPDLAQPADAPSDPSAHDKNKVPTEGSSFDFSGAAQQMNWALIGFAIGAALLILRKGKATR
jgi:hypothetical protein